MTVTINREHEVQYNKKRIYRLMRILHFKSVTRIKKNTYIPSTPQITAENVLNRDFHAEKPNEKWLTDVTEFKYYVCPVVKKLYLSAILDLYDRRIVAFNIGDRNNNELVFLNFDEAIAINPDAHPIFHSDRGYQYTSMSCQTLAKERWIEGQKTNLLNVGYFHIVFTVPSELNTVIYQNQNVCYNILFRAVSETLQELCSDKKYLGAKIGFTLILHTWGQNPCFHPHIHCVMAGGGLNKLGKLLNSRKKFLLLIKVPSRKFRGKFLALMKD